MTGMEGLREPEKQGYLGDLHNKSRIELQEILNRQQKLLRNKVFMKKLSDGGVKIEQLVSHVQSLLTTLQDVDTTADLLQHLDIHSQQRQRERIGLNTNVIDTDIIDESMTEDERLLRKLATRGTDQKVVVDHRTSALGDQEAQFTNSYEKVIKTAERREHKAKFRPNRSIRAKDVKSLGVEHDVVTLTSGVAGTCSRVQTDSTQTGRANSTQTGRADSTQTVVNPEIPRTIHTTQHVDTEKLSTSGTTCTVSGTTCTVSGTTCTVSGTTCTVSGTTCTVSGNGETVSSVPSVSLNDSPTSRPIVDVTSRPIGDVTSGRGKLRYRYDESLETQLYTGACHCQSANMISIQESVSLQHQQHKHIQEMQAVQAADRLAQRVIKMDTYNPEGSRYRDPRHNDHEDDEDDDEDDERDDLDYPD